ncbi:TonB-dependent receptor [Methylomonas sp. UP202]|uniref:TonB-dependent siderophore receptor n=1 Tax=Methylomonas sp. UP202 TaxID=3040943 RepID=UPI00247AFB58|nr:TonB-dependent receptor [Methylomonas sp. UP202]WGS88407.1 TonB-dependent receptor [Methylomonas sp. UP202]
MIYQDSLTRAVVLISAVSIPGIATAETTTLSFDIASQPLSSALIRFSAISGLQVLYEGRLADQIQAPALKGSFSAEQALRQLLQGSGLSFRFSNASTVTLDKTPAAPAPQSNGTATMPAVTVTGQGVYDTASPYNKDYALPNATTGTKTDTLQFDTPVSVQVIPKAVIEDQQAIGLENVLKNVSGVAKNWGFGADANENIYLRGFANGINSVGNIYRDGVLTPNMPISLANAERVEVLKGPAAMLYGRAQPGGLVNVVTKRPRGDAYYSLQQQFGSYDTYRTLLDATNKITEDGALAYRVNYEHLDSNSFRTNIYNQRDFLAPSLTWHITDKTQLDLDFIYQDSRSIADSGIPYDQQLSGAIPGKIPLSFNGNEPTDYSNKRSYQQGITLTHAFTDDWKVRAKFSALVQDSAAAQTPSNETTNGSGDIARGFLKNATDFDNKYGTIDITGRFATGPIQHNVLLGADYYNSTDKHFSSPYRTAVPTINVFDPQYGFTGFLNDPLRLGNIEHNEWYGIYLQDQLAWNDTWHLLLGGRFDNATYRNSFGDKTDDDYFSPRIGLMYHPLDWLGVYVNFVKGFNAFNSGTALNGSSYDPEQSREMEFGMKGNWWSGKLQANLAFFELTKKNVKSPLPAPLSDYFVTIGAQRSRGIEFDLQGQLTDAWNVIATYTYIGAVVTKGLTGDFTGVGGTGDRLENIPRNTASLWSTYDFSHLGAAGLSAGAGVYLVDSREGNVNNSYEIPGYTRVDSMLRYRRKIGPSNVTFQFNVENLLDKEYIASANGYSQFIHQAMPGAPRTFLGSVKVEF